jgi:hypothetical protein
MKNGYGISAVLAVVLAVGNVNAGDKEGKKADAGGVPASEQGAVGIAQDAAKEGKKAEGEKVKVPEVEITLNGTIIKEEKTGEGGKVSVNYVLTTVDGTRVKLPTPKAQKAKEGAAPAAPAINLDDYLNAPVKIVGLGSETVKGEKKQIKISKLSSVEKSGATPEAPKTE